MPIWAWVLVGLIGPSILLFTTYAAYAFIAVRRMNRRFVKQLRSMGFDHDWKGFGA